VTFAGRGLSRSGSASSRPSAKSGIRHSAGTGPVTPSSRIRDWTVTRTSRRAAANIMKASGNSASTAETTLIVKPLDP
jgi:hypothetical protein